jgi:hypothetical protein
VPLQQEIDDLIASVGLLASARRGKLAVLTVGAPPESPEEFAARVERRLGAAGHPGVEVRVRPGAGPLRIVAVEFRR